MSRTLSELLAAQEPLFSLAIKDLEKACGQTSVDVRLTAEIMQKLHRGMNILGLDPNDTRGPEVYYALLSRIQQDDEAMARSIGATDPGNVSEVLPLVKKKVEELDVPMSAWVIKKSVAKEMIKKSPPKQVMKRLGYRSVDSMLKNENISEVFGAVRFAESPEYLNALIKKYKQLKPSDFETRDIEILLMSDERWKDLAKDLVMKKRHNITFLKELGVILMLPVDFVRLPGLTLTALPLLLHYINEIRLYSSFFKLKHVQPKFGNLIVETLALDPPKHAAIAGQPIHWRVIQRYFGRQDSNYHPEIFEPHVQPEDLAWRKAEDTLISLNPTLEFWRGMDYVGALYDGQPVSFNLTDMAISYMNQAPYEFRATYHFRESLWNEIFIRYMGQKTLEDQVLRQLDTEVIVPARLGRLQGKFA